VDQRHAKAPAPGWVAYARNRFWLLVPVLLLDLALAGRLPPALEFDRFWSDIPAWIVVAENVLRVLVVAVPLLMPLAPAAGLVSAAVWTYGVGLAAYTAAWLMVVLAPSSAWSTSVVGFTAPAWTSLGWLVGIGLGSRLRLVRGYRPWMYLAVAASFTAVHTFHAVIIWTRYY
jgi:hypothetical protein